MPLQRTALIITFLILLPPLFTSAQVDMGNGVAQLGGGTRDSSGAPSVAANPAAGPIVFAAYSEKAGKSDRLTSEAVASDLKLLESSLDIGEPQKQECIERLKKAAQWLNDEQAAIARQAEHETAIAAVPNQLELAKAELNAPSPTVRIEFPTGATVAQLETKLAEWRQQVEVDEAMAKAKELECENRATRHAEVTKEILAIEKKIIDAQERLNTLQGSDVVGRSSQSEQRARLQARTQQVTALKLEQRRLEAIAELVPMQRDLAKRAAVNSRKLLQKWQDAVDSWRKEESQKQATEARRVAENSHPALRSLAMKNAEIAELRIQTAAAIEQVSGVINGIDATSKDLESDFNELSKKVDYAGATSSTGILLLNQRAELPADEEFEARAAFVRRATPSAHLKALELNRLRRQMTDPAEMAQQMLGAFENSLAGFKEADVLAVLTRLLSDRRDFIDKAAADQNTYLQDLNELELANNAFAEQVADFRQYLDQRVMWIRSADPISMADVKRASSGTLELLSPVRWMEILRVGGGALLSRPAGAIAVASLFLLIFYSKAKLLASQKRLMDLVTSDQNGTYWHIILSVGIAIALSSRWPVLLLVVGFRLEYANEATVWTHTVGESCWLLAFFVWGWEGLKEICRARGVGEQLFRWPVKTTSTLRKALELSFFLCIPILVLYLPLKYDTVDQLASLERILFIALLTLVSLISAILLRPNGGLLQSLKEDERYSKCLFCTFGTPIWLLTTLTPLTLACLSIGGFHFSASELSARFAETLALVIGVILIHHTLFSWLDVRDKSVEPDPTPADILPESLKSGEHPNIQGDDGPDQLANLQAQNEFRDLLRYAALVTLLGSGLLVWASVMPALRILDGIELWQNIETVAETTVDDNDVEELRTFERSFPTTVTDILMAIVVCIVTLTMSSRLPGFLRITILGRLPFDAGGRQAVAILVRYAATIVGLLFACKLIHVSWGSVQWLAAAMTVGLGFGLQEIFANLVSGLIILFERPIRIGDLVTVGDTTGSITRMQMRATTITDFDRRELIVPNKTFITSNVVNWTLSDPISRVVIPIGLAYGTDVKKTQALLLRIARRSGLVLRNPMPTTLFRGFGESTLDVDLRVFIANRDLYLDVLNELNGEIVTEFAKHDIQIAFPQRDLHIKSFESIETLPSSPHKENEEQSVRRKAG